jgi:hypothetical protein
MARRQEKCTVVTEIHGGDGLGMSLNDSQTGAGSSIPKTYTLIETSARNQIHMRTEGSTEHERGVSFQLSNTPSRLGIIYSQRLIIGTGQHISIVRTETDIVDTLNMSAVRDLVFHRRNVPQTRSVIGSCSYDCVSVLHSFHNTMED